MFRLILISFLTTSKILSTASEIPATGHENCPCLPGPVDLEENQHDLSTMSPEYVNYIRENVLTNATGMFGVGCAPHSAHYCELKKNECEGVFPKPKDCLDLSWCERSWCFVDAKACNLTHRVDPVFDDLEYSFGTCGYMDNFVEVGRLSYLSGKTLKVAFMANSGGYQGSYNPAGSFATNDDWKGPLVTFIEHAARVADFRMELVAPPKIIEEEAHEYFNSTRSLFDYCAYAAALGYVDFCVGDFLLTEQRITSGSWFNFGTKPVFLVSFLEKPESKFTEFMNEALTLMRPFTPATWLLILLFFVPMNSFLLLFHDYGEEGGLFPERNKKNIFGYVITAWYEVFLSLFAGYGQPVVSRSGKIHLLGITFFNLVLVTVYTANLAAILSASDLKSNIKSLDDVRNNGFKICVGRRTTDLVTGVYPEISDLILNDPVDGRPGFEGDISRYGPVDFMKSSILPEEREKHCEVAIMSNEDMETLYGRGLHCNKTMVGSVLTVETSAMPISPRFYEGLWSILQREMNDGVLQSEINLHRPANSCPAVATTTSATLTIPHLSSLWVLTCAFAIAALVYRSCTIGKKMLKKEEV